MGLVDDQERLVPARELAERVVEPRLRGHDSDVRQRRLGEHARDVAVCEGALERLRVVPFDDSSRLVERYRGAEVALALDDAAAGVECRERLVDRAVVAPVEHEDLGPAGDLACEPDREAVRIRRRERELPAWDAEAPRELRGDDEGVLARQHQRDPPRRLLRNGTDGRLRRVPGHCAGVAEAEVDVLEPVGVTEARAGRLDREDREAASRRSTACDTRARKRARR
jgi:hypothetical protein